ncbi:MAG: transporter permease [Thermoproteota archaeon]|nr:transporter permease [Thermoproteota archaeon]
MDVEELVRLLYEDIPRRSSELTHIWAVFWANFKIFLSYRSWVITETLSTVASIAMYSFMGLQVAPDKLSGIGYGDVDWLAFALIGVATANYLWMCISRISHSMLNEIREGTLEYIVSTSIRMRSYIIGQSIRGFLVSGYFMAGVILVGLFLLKVPLVVTFETILSFLMIITLMVGSYVGIGVMIAGIILVYKRGDPLTFLFASITEFLGGVLFPIGYLRSYPLLWSLAWLMPYTYALDAARYILLVGGSLTSPSILNDIIILVVYTFITIPIGFKVFKWGYNRIRAEGTTATY